MRDPTGREVYYNPGEPDDLTPDNEDLTPVGFEMDEVLSEDGPDNVSQAAERFMLAAERLPSPLYAYPAEWHEVLTLLAEERITEEDAETRLNQIAGDFKHKALAAAVVIQNHDRAAEECDAEAKRLISRRDRMSARAQWLRGYVQAQMEAIPGLERIEGGTFRLVLRANNPHVLVTDDGLVPRRFLRFPTAPGPEVDRSAILREWRESGGEDGGSVPPGVSIERKIRLDIS